MGKSCCWGQNGSFTDVVNSGSAPIKAVKDGEANTRALQPALIMHNAGGISHICYPDLE